MPVCALALSSSLKLAGEVNVTPSDYIVQRIIDIRMRPIHPLPLLCPQPARKQRICGRCLELCQRFSLDSRLRI